MALSSAMVSSASSQETAVGGDSDPLSLDSAIMLALETNPELRASGGRVDAAAGRAYQAGAWPNPELELAAEDWTIRDGNGFSDAKQTIGITQALPFPGKKSLDRQIGGAGMKLSEAELALRRVELIRDVKICFFRVLASEQWVETATQLVSMAESSASITRKRADAGATAYQEQLRAEVQVEQARAGLADVQRELAAARQFLATLLGRPDLSAAKLKGSLVETPDASLMDGTAERRLAGHPS
ncbi:MAG: TolC family protein, partial [Opitutaceae bacterium]